MHHMGNLEYPTELGYFSILIGNWQDIMAFIMGMDYLSIVSDIRSAFSHWEHYRLTAPNYCSLMVLFSFHFFFFSFLSPFFPFSSFFFFSLLYNSLQLHIFFLSAFSSQLLSSSCTVCLCNDSIFVSSLNFHIFPSCQHKVTVMLRTIYKVWS